jgi:carbamoyltransferase
MNVLGVNAVFHDPAAALTIDGVTVAAAEEERFSRRKHGKPPVAFATWELPEQAMRWCLEHAGLAPGDLDAVAYSYDPRLALSPDSPGADDWEHLRTLYAQRAPRFLRSALPGLDSRRVRFVGHHVAHAASAHVASPHERSAILVADGRGERASSLLAHGVGGEIRPLAAEALPHSLGLLYEDLTAHLGFHRSSDEYKVMALASYGEPRFADELGKLVLVDGAGGYRVAPIDFGAFAPALAPGGDFDAVHADLAASVQQRLEEVLLDLSRFLHARTGERALTMAGGVALNCVANRRLLTEGPFERIWVQPAAGDAGTALGAAMAVATQLGDEVAPIDGVDLGRGFADGELEALLETAELAHERPGDVAEEAAEVLAGGGVVAWFQGTGRGRSAIAACSPTRVPPATSSGSTTSRAASSSARSPRWCCSSVRTRSSRARSRAPTCCSPTACARAGATASRPSCTSTARRACRPSTGGVSPWWPGCSRRSSGAPACRSSSTRASTRPAGRWSTTRATRSRSSARRRSTRWRSDRSWCGAWASRTELGGSPARRARPRLRVVAGGRVHGPGWRHDLALRRRRSDRG